MMADGAAVAMALSRMESRVDCTASASAGRTALSQASMAAVAVGLGTETVER